MVALSGPPYVAWCKPADPTIEAYTACQREVAPNGPTLCASYLILWEQNTAVATTPCQRWPGVEASILTALRHLTWRSSTSSGTKEQQIHQQTRRPVQRRQRAAFP